MNNLEKDSKEQPVMGPEKQKGTEVKSIEDLCQVLSQMSADDRLFAGALTDLHLRLKKVEKKVGIRSGGIIVPHS